MNRGEQRKERMDARFPVQRGVMWKRLLWPCAGPLLPEHDCVGPRSGAGLGVEGTHTFPVKV